MMKMAIKRLIAVFTMLTLMLPYVTVRADDENGVIPEQTQPLTVVAKRIRGDDTYFEISLEVNQNHEEFSSVGVVLRYDPEYIIPADSWDEEAGPADMSENYSWATRRALPTLGLDTWSTHTAFAYQEQIAEAENEGKTYGYLYLSAEYPKHEEGPDPKETTNPNARLEPALGDPDAEEGGEGETETPTKAETGTAPVVVVRFMYKTTEFEPGLAVKEKLVNEWRGGTNITASVVTDHPTNWDYDWKANKILTVAGDLISHASPAQYPFAIYTQDYKEKAYMHEFPPEVGEMNTELKTVGDYDRIRAQTGNGSAVKIRLTFEDLKIVTLEGDSAKAMGGLSLSDIYTILFFDWDDKFLGALTAGVGIDPTEAVHNYTKEKFIHPELRDVDYLSLSEDERKQRKYNYRGEYPEEGPDPSDPLAKTGKFGDSAKEAGSKYPLTNKLDYCFGGKQLVDEEHPYTYAYGWTLVLSFEPDYGDTSKWGSLADALPKSQADTFTSATVYDQASIEFMPKDLGGGVVDPAAPKWLVCDFSQIDQNFLDWCGGSIYVKAVYESGEYLGRDEAGVVDNSYIAVGPATTEVVSTVGTVATYGISFIYERINEEGHGVSRIREPAVNMALTQVGASASTPITVMLENADKMPVMLMPTNAVDTVGYQLRETYNASIVTGDEKSRVNSLDEGLFKLQGTSGLIYQFTLYDLLDQAYEYAMDSINNGTAIGSTSSPTYKTAWTTAATYSALSLFQTATNTKTTALTLAAKLKVAQVAIVNLVKDTILSGADYRNIDWYQLQYQLIKTTAATTVVPYVDEATSKATAREYIQSSAQAAEEAYLALG